MKRWVALLRGINVGGGNRVPMAELRTLATSIGWRDVQSYIASGNLVFQADGNPDGLEAVLRSAMADRLDVDVPVFILSAGMFRNALAGCPFEPQDGRHVHGFVLRSKPRFDTRSYIALKKENEELDVRGRMAWLHAPDGVGRSKLAEKLDKVIAGTEMTGRNLNTLRELARMLDDAEA